MEYPKFNIDAKMKTEIEGKKYTWRQLTLDDLIVNELRFPFKLIRNQKGKAITRTHNAEKNFAIFKQICENAEGLGKDWKEKVPIKHELRIAAEAQKFVVSEWKDFQGYYPDLKQEDSNSHIIYAVSKQAGVSIPHMFKFKMITEHHIILYDQLTDFTNERKGKKTIIQSEPKAKQLNDLFDELIISVAGYCLSDEKAEFTPQMTPAHHKQEVITSLFESFSADIEEYEGN